MKIEIICIGKIKEDYMKSAIDTYIQRLRPYCKLEIIEVKDSDKEKESKRILEAIEKRANSYIIALSEDGEQFSSVTFSNKFKNLEQDIVFIIGGAEGFSEEVKKKSNEVLSLSGMTFLHDMARLFLVEQIYRAHKILKGEPYHK
tara:strand:+ start:1219 stop:1653 length:435 start_codon:yes stop_codon:yes gene_type:complete